MGKKNEVSFEAMDLINSLLQEKEHRICSKKYMLNDFVHSNRSAGQLIASPANKHARDYQGYYVYPDDATDIKAHTFFHGIAWDRLHLTRPPFIPDIKGRDDTKYFDEEEPISDVDDASSISSGQEIMSAHAHEEAVPVGYAEELDHLEFMVGPCQIPRMDGAANEDHAKAEAAAKAKDVNTIDKKPKKAKEKKRPRDRILRDKQVGRQVLELRKQSAFAGYTYRRPSVLPSEEERDRQNRTSLSRRSRIPSAA